MVSKAAIEPVWYLSEIAHEGVCLHADGFEAEYF